MTRVNWGEMATMMHRLDVKASFTKCDELTSVWEEGEELRFSNGQLEGSEKRSKARPVAKAESCQYCTSFFELENFLLF